MAIRNISSIAFVTSITIIAASIAVFAIEKSRIEAEHREVLRKVKEINNAPVRSVFSEVKDDRGDIRYQRCDSNGFCYSSSHREDIQVPVVKKSESGVGIPVFDGAALEAAVKVVK